MKVTNQNENRSQILSNKQFIKYLVYVVSNTNSINVRIACNNLHNARSQLKIIRFHLIEGCKSYRYWYFEPAKKIPYFSNGSLTVNGRVMAFIYPVSPATPIRPSPFVPCECFDATIESKYQARKGYNFSQSVERTKIPFRMISCFKSSPSVYCSLFIEFNHRRFCFKSGIPGLI